MLSAMNIRMSGEKGIGVESRHLRKPKQTPSSDAFRFTFSSVRAQLTIVSPSTRCRNDVTIIEKATEPLKMLASAARSQQKSDELTKKPSIEPKN